MKIKAMLLLAFVVALGVLLSTRTNRSDWRYPKLLITQAPKMPFRYFV